MKILIATLGTRGDIQPFIALGTGLKNAGHNVAVCTSQGHKAFVEEYELGYVFMSVVHHGGAGTTAAGLRAGKPTAVCPFLGDQPFWGRIIEQLGVGPKPVPQSWLTVDHIVSAIRTVTSDTEMQR